MYEDIDFNQFNLPPSFKEELKKGLETKTSNIITLKGSVTAQVTELVLTSSKQAEKVFWDNFEIILLQHGTTREQVQKMCRLITLHSISLVYKDLLENVKEDTLSNE